MGRPVLFATILVAAAATSAVAGPKKKVQIETTPAGAQVYLNAVEDGALCTTPCSIDAEVGDTTLINDLAGHKPIVETFVISKRDKNLKKSYKLVAALGKITVTGPRGASVTVDDEDKGKAPVELEVDAGIHAVVITLNGKQLYAQPVDVVAGDEISLEGGARAAEPPPVKDQGPGPSTGPAIHQVGHPTPRAGSIIALSAAFTVGFRKFQYEGSDANDPKLQPETEAGQMIAGPVIEIWPGTLAGIHALHGLAIMVRYQHHLNSQGVVKKDLNGVETPTSASTYWRSFESSLRQRWTLGGSATVEASIGYVRDEYSFSGMSTDVELVPDATYDAIRIGGRGSLLIGKVEPYFSAENRIVLSGGALETRFSQGATANGLRAALGTTASFGKLGGRVEASLTRYSWTFKNDGTAGANGASDSIKLISVVLGYAY
ncbi:MAG: hypothetical protein H6Q90_229 [Deltaproteobacteria bacterium]|nr:hypothetical protein [Deltaproteobacteria bacterium]